MKSAGNWGRLGMKFEKYRFDENKISFSVILRLLTENALERKENIL